MHITHFHSSVANPSLDVHSNFLSRGRRSRSFLSRNPRTRDRPLLSFDDFVDTIFDDNSFTKPPFLFFSWPTTTTLPPLLIVPGKRACLGAHLASRELFIASLVLLQKFSFSIPVDDVTTPRDAARLRPIQGITNIPPTHRLVATPRGTLSFPRHDATSREKSIDATPPNVDAAPFSPSFGTASLDLSHPLRNAAPHSSHCG